jgi:hypothetical protein
MKASSYYQTEIPVKSGGRRQQLRYPSGQLRREFTVRNGHFHGIERAWHENGQLSLQRPWKNGMVDGVCRQWSKDGRLLGTYRMKAGTGRSIKWHENGAIETEMDIRAGVLNGLLRIWTDDGLLVTQRFFVDNRPVAKKKYDLLRRGNSLLPAYESVNVKNSLARWFSGVRKARSVNPSWAAERRTKFDAQCEAELSHEDTVNTRKWRNRRCSFSIGDMDSKEARCWLGKLTALGALAIWATGVEVDPDGSEHGVRLIVQLPEDVRSRKTVMDSLLRQSQTFQDGHPAVVAGNRYAVANLV